MTHAERRKTQRIARCEAGDPRALLLAATEPQHRSEVAARYDHAIEAAELDRDREPTLEESERLAMELWRSAVAVRLAEQTVYHRSVERYLGGHIMSAGMQSEVARAEAATPWPTASVVRQAWSEQRKLRREYIRQRYGV